MPTATAIGGIAESRKAKEFVAAPAILQASMSDQRPASAISSARMRSRKGVTPEARSIVTVSVEARERRRSPRPG